MNAHSQRSFLRPTNLFNDGVASQFLSEKVGERIPELERRRSALRGWVRSLEQRQHRATEGSLEQGFNQRVLVETLGYNLYPSQDATAWPKPPSEITNIPGEPDVVLGELLDDGSFTTLAVLELKPPGTNLDLPQPRAGRKTPVEQAFEYGEAILGVRWVLVSDMRVIRLYSIESRNEYETFDLQSCLGAGDNQANREFMKFYFLLHYDNLIAGGTESSTARLLSKSLEHQIKIRDTFYSVYYQIRSDLLPAVESAITQRHGVYTREQVLGATQRLLDRMLFLYYCEDHPNRLITPNTVRDVTQSARRLPGLSDHRVYDSLKALFREVDEGSPRSSGIQISPYNGELFKKHVIDEIDLPDILHDKIYLAEQTGGTPRQIEGVWGLHKFDFWQELNEHLLGHIFQESLSDTVELISGSEPDLAEKLSERRRWGIYFTDQILSDFLVDNALQSVLDDTPDDLSSTEEDLYLKRLETLSQLRVVDFACGSGAFLVSAYREMLSEHLRLRSALEQMASPGGSIQLDLESYGESLTQARMLRESLYGVDLLPQAVEIAKLALWLRSAKKGERVADLGGNIISCDSLDIESVFARTQMRPGRFDLVVGNPPWGGEVDPDLYGRVCQTLDLPLTPAWDSWELFLALALYALREGGRLAMVLPDTVFSPEKQRIRRLLLERTAIERLHNLGPDWFGPNVRMGTVVLQARKGRDLIPSDIISVLLMGRNRKKVISGELPLRQVEATLGRKIPVDRCISSPTSEIEIFRSRTDDGIIGRMEANSVRLAELCERARGEEMSKAGVLWRCPGCLGLSLPGRKKKGGGYQDKKCPSCGLTLSSRNTSPDQLVLSADQACQGRTAPYIDGDDIAHRYAPVVPRKRLRLDVPSWPYKGAGIYEHPKILIRQAGVGLCAAYDETGARCPQSVYLYRLRDRWLRAGYEHEFLLACLLSRTMAYYVFKRFAEVDPARAHAKLTHARLEGLLIPAVDFSDAVDKGDYTETVAAVRKLLRREATIGGAEDLDIELRLRRLWRLTPEDGKEINDELRQLPDSQAVRELFPGPLRQ